MAKKKESIFTKWDEVDNSLKRLGELQIKKSKIEGNLNEKINELKVKSQAECTPIITEIKQIEKEIARFCEQNKESFVNKRNRKLNFGVISYRLTEKVVCNSVQSVIKSLKLLCLDHCLRVKEELDKDKIKELDTNTLTKIGVSIVKEDKLTIEPNIIEIVSTQKEE